ncbi:hypothetical protein GXW71_13600 [Roseomonas hellenica]|uniref:Uncharacterized protein n=1 Tax=Plastoroseomonas hellenica TaxID=2687306 RepID=A0ABS5EYN3_9PROT|nr:hypothetical protein [Plastoroseomonas hellenica]MBR0665394.1 hypothetical protein [Plastoroseomonas hellenica]
MASPLIARLWLTVPLAGAGIALRVAGQVHWAAAAEIALVSAAIFPSRRLPVLAAVAAVTAGLALALMRPGAPELVFSALPLVADLLLGLHFGATLGPGREALIHRYIRAEQGRVPPECVRYAWRLTALWTLAFVGFGLVQALALVGIGLTPLQGLWLQAALMPTLFLGEHLVRARLFPALPASPVSTIRSILRASHAG